MNGNKLTINNIRNSSRYDESSFKNYNFNNNDEKMNYYYLFINKINN